MGNGSCLLFLLNFKTHQEAPNRQTDWLERSANIYMYNLSVCVSLSLHGSE